METSAKSGLNVNELFCEIGKRLYKETEKQNKIDKVRKIFFFFFFYNNLNQLKYNLNNHLLPYYQYNMNNDILHFYINYQNLLKKVFLLKKKIYFVYLMIYMILLSIIYNRN